jgi:glycosyltransferase involved in cell wall biosynthesis
VRAVQAQRLVMKVLFIGPLPDPLTGHSLACKVLLDELTQRHEVAVVNLSKPELTSGFSSFARFGSVLGILNEVRRKRAAADVVYLTISESVAGNIKDLLIYWLCRRKLSRIVVHLHGGSLKAWIFDKYRLLRWLNGRFLAHIGAVIVLGRSHLRIFAGMVAPERVHVIANFAQDYLFGSEERVVRKFQQRGVLRILFLSNLISGKGHEDMLAAYFALPAGAQARICLDLAGAFESPHDGRRFSAAIAGAPNIIHHGVVDGERKRALLADAHALCLPTSLFEGQPISILEAYAAGCIVLTTARGGIPDVFADGVNGLLIEPGRPESLRAAFVRMLEDPGALLPLALHNLHVARERYRAARYSRDVAQVLDRVAGA